MGKDGCEDLVRELGMGNRIGGIVVRRERFCEFGGFKFGRE